MRRLNRRFALFTIAVFLMISLTGCKDEPLKVAVIARLETGSVMGMSTWDQVKFYLSDHPNSPLSFVPYSDDGTKEGAKAIYEAIRKEGIDVILTAHKSDSAIWLTDLMAMDTEPILMLAAGSTTELLTGIDDYFLRFVQSASQEQEAVVEYIDQKGYQKILVVRDIDNISYAKTAIDAFDALYDKDYSLMDVSISNLNFEAMRTKLEAIEYDFVYLVIGDYNINSGAIAQLAHQVNPKAKIMYNAWMKTQSLFETAGDSLSGSAMLSHYPPRGENADIDAYLDSYHEMFGYYPNTIGLTVYRIVELLDQSANDGHRTPDELKEHFIKEGPFKTLLGDIKLDPFGDTKLPFYYIEDIMGEFQ